MSNKKILVLGTGGTIAGRSAVAGDNIGYRAAEVGVDDLLQGLNPPMSDYLSLPPEIVDNP